MVNVPLLGYHLAKQKISSDMLKTQMQWSQATLFRRLRADSNWRLQELHVLIKLGLSWEDIWEIFFATELSKTTNG